MPNLADLVAGIVPGGRHLSTTFVTPPPLWDRLPAIAYWTLPTLAGVSPVTRALRSYTHLTRDLPAARQALESGIGGSS